MKYSPKQYAESLYDLTATDDPSISSENIKKFAGFIYANGDSSLLSDIFYQFNNIWKEKNNLTKEIANEKDGTRIRIKDTLIDNTIKERIKRLKEAINY